MDDTEIASFPSICTLVTGSSSTDRGTFGSGDSVGRPGDGSGVGRNRGGAVASGDWPRTVGPPWQPDETISATINSPATPRGRGNRSRRRTAMADLTVESQTERGAMIREGRVCSENTHSQQGEFASLAVDSRPTAQASSDSPIR